MTNLSLIKKRVLIKTMKGVEAHMIERGRGRVGVGEKKRSAYVHWGGCKKFPAN